VKYTDKKFTMCEYCFDDKQISKKDLKSLYQCESNIYYICLYINE